ncbi:hypothetical protein [Rhizobium oryzicola]|uniref:Uncharacterized protein n=1 Tax=Rhizobium oryzicola TaxID=1232668 RepID=A0ABT8SUY7_9HYPH|nr:hypothetical protein [Rhizobium oryzicola]MDO1581959.1 hypothetical protein [Rhizobium oryzicola]
MKALLIAAGIVLAGASASLAQPIPADPLPHEGLVQKIDWECGRGWRLNRWGDCVPIRRYEPPPRYWHRPPPPPPPGWGPPRGVWGHPPPPPRDWGPPPRWY